MEPATLVSSYGALRSSLHKLADYCKTRLEAELGSKPVTIQPRVKEIGSVHEKLQTGEFSSVTSLEDLVGVKVVLLRRSDIPPVLEVVRDSFQVVREKSRIIDPTTFAYREPHLILTPPADYLGRNEDLTGLLVEVQVTTVVQHALDQVTHSFDYKGSSLDWAKFRLVAELRAALELVDNLLDNVESSAGLIEQSVELPDALINQESVLGAISDVFADDRLPADRRRLAATASTWTSAAGLTADELRDLLRDRSDLVNAVSIGPLDAVLGALLDRDSRALLDRFAGRFAISDELATLCPEAAKIPAERRVSWTD